MKRYLVGILAITVTLTLFGQVASPNFPDNTVPHSIPGMELKWNDEFNVDGKPNTTNWKYENGFVRNEELQWYQPANVNCIGGVLLMEGKKEQVLNPNYVAGSTDWKKNRQYATFTSGSIISQGLQQFQFGRFEIRARIDTTKGSWPAIWTKGLSGSWPNCGETDIMEFYRSSGVQTILANVAWGSVSAPTIGTWDTKKASLSYFLAKDPDWCKKFYVWHMDWTKDAINLYLDDELLNNTQLSNTLNPPLNPPTVTVGNPHLQKHFFLLNLAIGANGGIPATTTNSFKYEVDYIRVYQDVATSINEIQPPSVRVFPNPIKTDLYFTTDIKVQGLFVNDMQGKIVMSIEQPNNKVSLSKLNQGLYFIKLVFVDGTQYSTKISKIQ